jgi:methionyl-tRNA formyltransferase
MHNPNKKLRIIFMGTPDFAVPSLTSLADDQQFEIVACVTQPDRPVGRNQILTAPPVKLEALKRNIPVLQPEKIKESTNELAQFKPDLIVVVAYAQILPENILFLPKYGCLNAHGSLLPKYRGAAVIHAPIMNGDRETGVTILKMDPGIDTGPILAQSKITISQTETAETLFIKISLQSAKILAPTIKRYITGEIQPVTQDDSLASYVGMLKRKDGFINWGLSAEHIEHFVRALTPWPGAYTHVAYTRNGADYKYRLKVIEVQNQILNINSYKVGEAFAYEDKLAVQCDNGALVINRIKLEGKIEMATEDFLRGNKEVIGTILR